jgi:hypothetical protein
MTGAEAASRMSRLPVAAFSALVAATVAAFFITQHLKVTTPLIAGTPRPVPPVINPIDGTTCGGVDHRRMRISFYVLHRADDVDVYVVSANGSIVRTLASGVHMAIRKRMLFVWNGRDDNGSYAPDGTYYVRVALIHQGRTLTIAGASGPEPFKVKTVAPTPRITSVAPHVVPGGAKTRITIRYTGNETRSGTLLIYRVGARGKANLVKSFITPWYSDSVIWDGLIRGGPAPPGSYLIALQVSDAACNTGTSSRVPVTVL